MATTKVRGELVDLNEATSESGLKIPTGTNANRPATDVAGMVRNNTNETSNSSASCEEYYNGAAWKVINNEALTLDLSNASLTSTQLITVTEGNARGYSFVPDGSALYITSMNGSSQDFLHKYTFSTAYDVTTISSTPTSFQITSPAINNYLSGCIVNAAESKIAYDPYTNTDWYQQNFGTPGDITTLQSASSFACSRTGGDRTARSMIFADNENKMYWMNNSMRQFDLTTAGDPGSGPACPTAIANTTDADFSADLDGGNTRSMFFNDNGTQFTIAGDAARLAQYTLSTAYDITTRGTATKYNFDTMLGAGASKEIYVIRPNASYTKLILAQPINQKTLYMN
jgi:hypothetical protein